MIQMLGWCLNFFLFKYSIVNWVSTHWPISTLAYQTLLTGFNSLANINFSLQTIVNWVSTHWPISISAYQTLLTRFQLTGQYQLQHTNHC